MREGEFGDVEMTSVQITEEMRGDIVMGENNKGEMNNISVDDKEMGRNRNFGGGPPSEATDNGGDIQFETMLLEEWVKSIMVSEFQNPSRLLMLRSTLHDVPLSYLERYKTIPARYESSEKEPLRVGTFSRHDDHWEFMHYTAKTNSLIVFCPKKKPARTINALVENLVALGNYAESINGGEENNLDGPVVLDCDIPQFSINDSFLSTVFHIGLFALGFDTVDATAFNDDIDIEISLQLWIQSAEKEWLFEEFLQLLAPLIHWDRCTVNRPTPVPQNALTDDGPTMTSLNCPSNALGVKMSGYQFFGAYDLEQTALDRLARKAHASVLQDPSRFLMSSCVHDAALMRALSQAKKADEQILVGTYRRHDDHWEFMYCNGLALKYLCPCPSSEICELNECQQTGRLRQSAKVVMSVLHQGDIGNESFFYENEFSPFESKDSFLSTALQMGLFALGSETLSLENPITLEEAFKACKLLLNQYLGPNEFLARLSEIVHSSNPICNYKGEDMEVPMVLETGAQQQGLLASSNPVAPDEDDKKPCFEVTRNISAPGMRKFNLSTTIKRLLQDLFAHSSSGSLHPLDFIASLKEMHSATATMSDSRNMSNENGSRPPLSEDGIQDYHYYGLNQPARPTPKPCFEPNSYKLSAGRTYSPRRTISQLELFADDICDLFPKVVPTSHQKSTLNERRNFRRILLPEFADYLEGPESMKGVNFLITGCSGDTECMIDYDDMKIRQDIPMSFAKDIDSYIVVSKNLHHTRACLEIFRSPDINSALRTPNHICVGISGKRVSLHQIPNICIGRFSDCHSSRLFIFFPGLMKLTSVESLTFKNLLCHEELADFFNNHLEPALKKSVPDVNYPHYDGHFFLGLFNSKNKLGSLSVAFTNQQMISIFDLVMGSCNKVERFRDCFVVHEAKDMKLVNRHHGDAQSHPLESIFSEQLGYLSLDVLQNEGTAAYFDYGAEFHPRNENTVLTYSSLFIRSYFKNLCELPMKSIYPVFVSGDFADGSASMWTVALHGLRGPLFNRLPDDVDENGPHLVKVQLYSLLETFLYRHQGQGAISIKSGSIYPPSKTSMDFFKNLEKAYQIEAKQPKSRGVRIEFRVKLRGRKSVDAQLLDLNPSLFLRNGALYALNAKDLFRTKAGLIRALNTLHNDLPNWENVKDRDICATYIEFIAKSIESGLARKMAKDWVVLDQLKVSSSMTVRNFAFTNGLLPLQKSVAIDIRTALEDRTSASDAAVLLEEHTVDEDILATDHSESNDDDEEERGADYFQSKFLEDLASSLPREFRLENGDLQGLSIQDVQRAFGAENVDFSTAYISWEDRFQYFFREGGIVHESLRKVGRKDVHAGWAKLKYLEDLDDWLKQGDATVKLESLWSWFSKLECLPSGTVNSDLWRKTKDGRLKFAVKSQKSKRQMSREGNHQEHELVSNSDANQ
ncbi:hypothetical protein DFJ73DRAFT_148834 [Zopfochytrium polystomum]|nr:hypothetical protein DFJ73DRAFT_148834 [Zopfochytrium polystomum]